MERRELLKGLLLIPSLVLGGEGEEGNSQALAEGEILSTGGTDPTRWSTLVGRLGIPYCRLFDANEDFYILGRIKVYLDGERIEHLCTKMYASVVSNVEVWGWCELFIQDGDNDRSFLMDDDHNLVTETRWGRVWWELTNGD